MATAMHNLSDYDFSKVPDASNMIFGVVVAEWNPEITGALLDGCVSTLERHGALPENIHVKTGFCDSWGDASFRLHLSGRHRGYRPFERHQQYPCHLWSAHDG